MRSYLLASTPVILLGAMILPAQESADPTLERASCGQVTDPIGRPVRGAELQLVDRLGQPVGGPLTKTGDGGAFTLASADLMAARTAGRSGGALLVRRRGRATVALAVGGDGPADFGTITLGQGMVWQGRVVDEDGEPVEGAVVRARAVDVIAGGDPAVSRYRSVPFPMSDSKRFDRPFAVTQSGADGRFRLEGAPPAGVWIEASHVGRISARTGVLEGFSRPELRLLRSGVLVGRLLDASGQPSGGTYELIEDTGERSQGRVSSDGTFLIRRKSCASAVLRLNISLRQAVERRIAAGDEPRIVLGDVRSGPEEAEPGVAMEPAADPAAATEASAVESPSLSLSVVDSAKEKPISGVQVAVNWSLPPEFDMPLDRLLAMLELEPFDAELGQLELPSRGVGRGGLGVAVAPGYAPKRFRVTFGENGNPAPVRVVLEREARAVGRVVDARSGEPIDGARVAWSPAVRNLAGRVNLFFNFGASGRERDVPLSCESADGGRFELGGLPAGGGSLRIERDGYTPSEQRLQLQVGAKSDEVVIRLLPAVAVRGQLTALDLPVGCRLLMRQNEPKRMQGMVVASVGGTVTAQISTAVDREGRFELQGVTGGGWELQLQLPRLGLGGNLPPVVLRQLEVPGDADLDLGSVDASDAVPVAVAGRVALRDLELPHGRLAVRCSRVTPDNERIVFESGRDRDYGSESVVLVDPAGAFRVRVPPGDWDLSLLDLVSGRDLASERVHVEAGVDSRNLEFRPELGWIDVRILGIEPGGFAGQWLCLRDSDAAVAQGVMAIRGGLAPVRGQVALHPGRSEYALLVPAGRHVLDLYATRATTVDDRERRRLRAASRLRKADGRTERLEVVVPASGRAEIVVQLD